MRSAALRFAALALVAVAALVLGPAAAAGSDAAGEAFLAENLGKDGVKALASGLQYKVLQKGGGGFHPTVDSQCTVHYHGSLTSGEVFDSSVDRGSPIDFAPNQVIKGWTEALQLMVEGDKWEVYLPSDLAYGASGSPPKIPPSAVLVFTIELIKINGDKVPASRCDVGSLEGCDDREKAFVEKMKAKVAEGFDVTKERARLAAMQGSKMKQELAQWLQKRLRMLEDLAESIAAGKEEL